MALVDAGIAGIAAGALGLLSRTLNPRRAGKLIGLGGLLGLAGAALPAPVRRARGAPVLLDIVLPSYEFREFHETRVNASPERAYEAILGVTAGEIRLFQTLTWLRSPRLPWGKPGPSTILNAPADRPILDVATSWEFCKLVEAPGIEIVVGMAVIRPRGTPPISAPADFFTSKPGYALAAMNFRIEYEGADQCRVTTETRVHATDAVSRRLFAGYWRLIYPGSSFIRVEWLRAIRRRAESQV
ncbi:MAG TPA: hypothetical protein VH394_19485 [Thermoanaerobaculia bacterium]|nr:hypothetical protein [Thermoanaerobaculia bacterium]